jgi:hypothetical protein
MQIQVHQKMFNEIIKLLFQERLIINNGEFPNAQKPQVN